MCMYARGGEGVMGRGPYTHALPHKIAEPAARRRRAEIAANRGELI